jgi:hypothetical protein
MSNNIDFSEKVIVDVDTDTVRVPDEEQKIKMPDHLKGPLSHQLLEIKKKAIKSAKVDDKEKVF